MSEFYLVGYSKGNTCIQVVSESLDKPNRHLVSSKSAGVVPYMENLVSVKLLTP